MGFCFRGYVYEYKNDIATIHLIDAIGNCFSSQIKKNILNSYHLEEGDAFKFYVRGDDVVVEPVDPNTS